MKITRASSFYRPYYVLVNYKWYKVNKINFYEKDSILVSSNSGWLENSNGGDITELELPVDEIKLKRKENFDGSVFVISRGKESYGNDVLADLYIPAEMLNIHFVKHEIAYKTQVRAIYQGEQDIYISKYVENIKIKKIFEFLSKYSYAIFLVHHIIIIICFPMPEKMENYLKLCLINSEDLLKELTYQVCLVVQKKFLLYKVMVREK